MQAPNIRSTIPFVVALILVATLGTTGCTDAARKNRHLATAQRYFAAGEYDKAEIEYKNVLQIVPVQPDAVGQLGIIYFEQGRVTSVYPLLKRAAELQPNNLAVRVKLGMFYLIAGKPEDARKEAEFVLQKDPKNPDAPLLLASAMTSAKEAIPVKKFLAGLPTAQTAPVKTALGFLEMRDGNFAVAAQILDDAIKTDPKFTEAHAAKGGLLLARNDRKGGEAEIKIAAEVSKPRSPRKLEYAQLKLQQGDLQEGRALLAKIAKESPDYLPVWLALAKVALREGKLDEASGYIDKVTARDRVHPEAVLVGAQINAAKGKYERAVDDLERALPVYPKMPDLHFTLGSILASRGNIDRAIDELQQAITLRPAHAESNLLLASLKLRKGESTGAIALLKGVLDREPTNLRAWLLLADAYRGQASYAETVAVYDRLDKLAPGNPQPSYLRGLVYIEMKKFADARTSFGEALKRSPGFSPALEQLVGIDVAEKKYDAALQRIESRIAEQPKDASNHILLARVYTAMKDDKRAEESLMKAISLQPELSSPYLLLAHLYLRTNRQDSALQNLEQAIARNPRDVQPLMTVAAIYDARKNYPKAREYYEKIVALNGRFAPALNNLAYLYSTYFKEVEKAFELAQRARSLRPLDPQVADTLGWVLFQRKQYSWAATLIQESTEKNPDDGEAQYHLGMAYYMAGNEEGARTALQRALELKAEFPGREEAVQRLAVLKTDPESLSAAARKEFIKKMAATKDDPVVLNRLARVQELEGDEQNAATTYQAVLEISPDNTGAMLRLAALFRKKGETANALELLKKARKAAPGNAQITHALGRTAFESGDAEWSFSLLQEAVRLLPDSFEALWDYAAAAYATGHVEDAEQSWALLAKNASGTLSSQAKQALDLSGIVAAPAARADADALITGALAADPKSAVAQMASGRRLESRDNPAGAQAVYEKIVATFPGCTPAHVRLAVIYSNQPASLTKAYEHAMKAFEVSPNDLDLRRLVGILVCRRGEYARAITLFNDVKAKRADDAELLYYQGVAYKGLSNKTASTQALRRALELNLRPDLAADAKQILSALAK